MMEIHVSMVENALRSADVEGLLELGAPADEYDFVAQVVHRALSELSVDEIMLESVMSVLQMTWRESFDLGAADLQKRDAALKALAEEIMAVVRG